MKMIPLAGVAGWNGGDVVHLLLAVGVVAAAGAGYRDNLWLGEACDGTTGCFALQRHTVGGDSGLRWEGYDVERKAT